MPQALMTQLAQSVKYWEQCWNPQICVNIPFDGTKCIGAHVCVRILGDGSNLYLEAEIDGHTARYGLADACIPALSIGIATLNVCITNLDAPNGHLKGLRLEVKVCIGGNIGPISLNKCWDLYGQDIVFSQLSSAEVIALLGLKGDHNAAEWAGLPFVVSAAPDKPAPGHCHCG